TTRTPRTSRPSSVSVPVLSKQTTSSLPPTLIRVGEIQKILDFLRRERANEVPMVRVAGRAGGTTMVIRSRARTMTRYVGSWSDRLEENINKHLVKVGLPSGG